MTRKKEKKKSVDAKATGVTMTTGTSQPGEWGGGGGGQRTLPASRFSLRRSRWTNPELGRALPADTGRLAPLMAHAGSTSHDDEFPSVSNTNPPNVFSFLVGPSPFPPFVPSHAELLSDDVRLRD